MEIKNNYICQFERELQSIPANEKNNFKLVINADRILDGAHNEPFANEVAVILVNEDYGKRGIDFRTHSNQLQNIIDTRWDYYSLQY